MKRLLAIIATLIMLLSFAVAEDHYDTACSLANFMEDHYNVTILIGAECNDIITDGFAIDDCHYSCAWRERVRRWRVMKQWRLEKLELVKR